jgi:hypothetical protein
MYYYHPLISHSEIAIVAECYGAKFRERYCCRQHFVCIFLSKNNYRPSVLSNARHRRILEVSQISKYSGSNAEPAAVNHGGGNSHAAAYT